MLQVPPLASKVTSYSGCATGVPMTIVIVPVTGLAEVGATVKAPAATIVTTACAPDVSWLLPFSPDTVTTPVMAANVHAFEPDVFVMVMVSPGWPVMVVDVTPLSTPQSTVTAAGEALAASTCGALMRPAMRARAAAPNPIVRGVILRL